MSIGRKAVGERREGNRNRKDHNPGLENWSTALKNMTKFKILLFMSMTLKSIGSSLVCRECFNTNSQQNSATFCSSTSLQYTRSRGGDG